MTPELSVIICTLNGSSSISGALDSLAAQRTDVEWELIVSDNGSTDDTLDVVRRHPQLGQSARIVDASARRGLSHARNAGVQASNGRFVAFVDDDDEVDPEWVQIITESLREHRFVGSQMEYQKLNSESQMTGRAKFQSSDLGSIFGQTVVNGAGFGIERELWLQVGGNDETMTSSAEDLDFSIRVQQSTGVIPVLAAGAFYHYRQRDGFLASFRQGRNYGRGHATLAARYASLDQRALDTRRSREVWWWVMTRAPLAFSPRRRTLWGRQLGIRLGRLHALFSAKSKDGNVR